jgi:hypothetical protein
VRKKKLERTEINTDPKKITEKALPQPEFSPLLLLHFDEQLLGQPLLFTHPTGLLHVLRLNRESSLPTVPILSRLCLMVEAALLLDGDAVLLRRYLDSVTTVSILDSVIISFLQLDLDRQAAGNEHMFRDDMICVIVITVFWLFV